MVDIDTTWREGEHPLKGEVLLTAASNSMTSYKYVLSTVIEDAQAGNSVNELGDTKYTNHLGNHSNMQSK